MLIDSKDFRVRSGENVNLGEWPTIVKPFLSYPEPTKAHRKELLSIRKLLAKQQQTLPKK
jgi:hypothetical protein